MIRDRRLLIALYGVIIHFSDIARAKREIVDSL